MRFPVQQRRAGHTTTVTIGGEQFTLVANQRADGTLGEVLIAGGKHGSAGAGLLDSYATALSVGLAYQVPLADLLRSGLDLHFTPSGHTDDPEVPRVRSVADYLARRLAIDWLPYPERAALGIYPLTERVTLAGSWMKTRDPAICWEMAASVGA
jgi:ribonucleoside-diphosphate reductase alpha chain